MASEAFNNLMAAAEAVRAVRPGFGVAMTHLLNTPGAKSSDPAFKQPPPPKDIQMAPTITNELQPSTADTETVKLANEMTAYFKANSLDVSLRAPESLTTYKAGKGFSKTPHIGGEGFDPAEAYVGKKGKIIIKFKPSDAVAYSHMEMLADEAMMKMNGFAEIAAESCEDGYVSRVAGVRRAVSMEREAEVAKVKVQEYADYGSW